MASSAGKTGTELLKRMSSQLAWLANNGGGIDKVVLNQVRITSAEKGRLVAEMKVDKYHTNFGGTLHGAMSSYLVDCLSTLALSTCPDVSNWGVSLDLHVTFLKAAALGQEIEIVSKVHKAGGKMAFLSVDILDKHTKELIAKGAHTKFTAVNNPKFEIPQ